MCLCLVREWVEEECGCACMSGPRVSCGARGRTGGDAKALMIVCVNPAQEAAAETNCSLTFAASVRAPVHRMCNARAHEPNCAAPTPQVATVERGRAPRHVAGAAADGHTHHHASRGATSVDGRRRRRRAGAGGAASAEV